VEQRSRGTIVYPEPRDEDHNTNTTHLLFPKPFAARLCPLEPYVNKPRGSHIKVVGHRSTGRLSDNEVSIHRKSGGGIEMADLSITRAPSVVKESDTSH